MKNMEMQDGKIYKINKSQYNIILNLFIIAKMC